MGCKVYMDSYVASNGSCFMVIWTIFKNHMLEVGLAQNQEIMALRTFTTVGLVYFNMCEDHEWIECHWNSIWWRVQSYMTSHCTWGSMTTLHDFGGVLGRPLDTFFGLSQSRAHGSWRVCEVTLPWGHCILEFEGPWPMIYKSCDAREVGDSVSPLYTSPWRPMGLKKFKWMRNLRVALHGNKWIIFCGLPVVAIVP